LRNEIVKKKGENPGLQTSDHKVKEGEKGMDMKGGKQGGGKSQSLQKKSDFPRSHQIQSAAPAAKKQKKQTVGLKG